MTPVEVLEMALSRENISMKMYQDLSNKHPEIRDLLTTLFNEEYKHKKMIQEKIVEIKRY